MKRIRKGIVVLVVAAGAAGVIGSGASAAQAGTTEPAVTVVKFGGGPIVPQSFGSSWQ